MPESTVVCERLTLTHPDEEGDTSYLVQYETPADLPARRTTILALTEAGWAPVAEPHHVVGHDDDPAVSWGDLADLMGVGQN